MDKFDFGAMGLTCVLIIAFDLTIGGAIIVGIVCAIGAFHCRWTEYLIKCQEDDQA